MKKLYEDFKVDKKHYIECVGNNNVLIENVIIRVIKEQNNKK